MFVSVSGFGKFHIVVTLILGLAYITVVMEIFGISMALPAARCDLLFNTSEQGLLGAINFIGKYVVFIFFFFFVSLLDFTLKIMNIL